MKGMRLGRKKPDVVEETKPSRLGRKKAGSTKGR